MKEMVIAATLIYLEGVARLDDPCEFMGSEGVGECQADHVLLDVGRHTHLAR